MPGDEWGITLQAVRRSGDSEAWQEQAVERGENGGEVGPGALEQE